MNIEVKKREEIVFELFDIIKSKLNRFLLKGLEYITDSDLKEMLNLTEKLSSMNLNLISSTTKTFSESLEKLQKDKGKETKIEASVNALKMITTLRTFETIMSVELIKSSLI